MKALLYMNHSHYLTPIAALVALVQVVDDERADVVLLNHVVLGRCAHNLQVVLEPSWPQVKQTRGLVQLAVERQARVALQVIELVLERLHELDRRLQHLHLAAALQPVHVHCVHSALFELGTPEAENIGAVEAVVDELVALVGDYLGVVLEPPS